jgi:two-component system cell cycle sensor histidine kinase/response regulator CckA
MDPPAPGRPGRPRSLRIVVTDDDPRVRTLLATILRRAGHCVFEAHDGLAACELATQIRKVDLLVTNTRLGDLDAPELIREVRRQKPWLAILHVGDPLPDAGAPLGDVPTLREPFTPEQLLAAVADVLESSGGAAEPGGRSE